MPSTLRVLVIDSHMSVAQAVSRALGSASDVDIVGVEDTARGGVEAHGRLMPDVVVLDALLRDMSPVNVIEALLAAAAATRVVALTPGTDAIGLLAALDAGAHGVAAKAGRLDELLDVVRRVASGQCRVVSTGDAAALLEHARGTLPPRLTPRELEVLAHVATGQKNREIAAQLGVSPKTIETHRARLYAKLDVDSATSAVRTAIRTGLLHA